jgi:hypothetical protein
MPYTASGATAQGDRDRVRASRHEPSEPARGARNGLARLDSLLSCEDDFVLCLFRALRIRP